MPLDYGYPMQIFPGVSFHYSICARGSPTAHLRVDLMSVPSLRRDNASAYAIHVWSQVRRRMRAISWAPVQTALELVICHSSMCREHPLSCSAGGSPMQGLRDRSQSQPMLCGGW